MEMGLDRVKENPEDLFVREVKGKNHIFHKNRMTHSTVLPNTWWDKMSILHKIMEHVY